MEKVCIGIVGIGNMGSAHANNIFAGKVTGLELAAVCDIDEGRRAWAKENLPGVDVYESYEDLLNSDRIQAVLVATPHKLHPVIATAAMKKGLHVLTEKPAGVSVKAVHAMNEVAKQSDVVFGIMYNQRTNPIFRKMRELIQNGELGNIKRSVWIVTNWYRTQAYYNSGSWRATWNGEGGGVMLNQCPHNLDIWQWLVGMPTRVRAFCSYGKYHNIEVEDDVTIYTQYENGASGVFVSSTGEYPGTNRLEISGDKGKLVAENGTLKFWKLEQSEREVCFEATAGFVQIPMEEINIEITEKETAHVGILQNFTDAILKGMPLLAPGIEGIRGLSISNAAHLSDWTDDWVTIPVDEDRFEELLEEHKKAEKGKTVEQGKKEKLSGEYSTRWSVRW